MSFLWDFKMLFDIRFIYQKYKKLPLPAGMLLPKKTASVDFSLEIEFACLLGEGLLDFLLLHPETTDTQLSRISYLLQATKTKISRTEYIACPSCGRTLFNLQEVTEYLFLLADSLLVSENSKSLLFQLSYLWDTWLAKHKSIVDFT